MAIVDSVNAAQDAGVECCPKAFAGARVISRLSKINRRNIPVVCQRYIVPPKGTCFL